MAEDDISELKLNRSFTGDEKAHDADFQWAFTKTTFTVKGTGVISAHVFEALLHDGATADEVTGSWKLGDGTLELSDIEAGKQEGRKGVKLGVFTTAPTVVRGNSPHSTPHGKCGGEARCPSVP